MSLARPTEARSETLANSPGSPWMALLWRDLRLQAPAMAILGILSVMLLIWPLILSLMMEQGISDAEAAKLAFGVIPVLSAALSAALLFGNEMDSRAWNWANTLPIRPRQALLLRVCSAAAIAGFFMALGWLLARAGDLSGLGQTGWKPPKHLILIGFKYWIVTFSLFSIAILVFRDTLTSLVVGAVVLLLVESVQPPIFFDSISLSALSLRYDSFHALGAGVALAVIGVLAGGLLLVHERAWLQRDPLLNWDRWKGLRREPAILRWMGLRRVTSPVRPRLPYALMWLGVRQDWILRAGVLALASAPFVWPSFSMMVISNLPVLIAVSGVLAFVGDQRRNRFRFLANRGFPVGWIVGSRLLITLATVLLPLVLLVWNRLDVQTLASYNRIFTELPVILFLLSTAIFAGVCFRSTVLALIVVLGAMALWVRLQELPAIFVWFGISEALYFLYHRLFESGLGMDPGLWMVLLLGLGLMVAFLAVLYRMVRRWLVLDRPGLVRRFAVVVPLLALSIIGWGQLAMLVSIPKVPEPVWASTVPLTAEKQIQSSSIFRPDGMESNAVSPLSSALLDQIREALVRKRLELNGVVKEVEEVPGEITLSVRNQKLAVLTDQLVANVPRWNKGLKEGLHWDQWGPSSLDRDLTIAGVFLMDHGKRELGIDCLAMAGKLRQSTPALYLFGYSNSFAYWGVQWERLLLEQADEDGIAKVEELAAALYPDTQLSRQLVAELVDLSRETGSQLGLLASVWNMSGKRIPDSMFWSTNNVRGMVQERELDLLRFGAFLELDLQDRQFTLQVKPDQFIDPDSASALKAFPGSDFSSKLSRYSISIRPVRTVDTQRDAVDYLLELHNQGVLAREAIAEARKRNAGNIQPEGSQ